jgi:ABC transporter substrate binding protein (PQQ-dependent alcohol dehydrogenase system)
MAWRSMNKALLFAALAALSLAAPAAQAAAIGHRVTIGYLDIADDPRYDATEGPAESMITPPRPIDGVEMAIFEVNIDASVTGRSYKLDTVEVDKADQLAARVDAMAKAGVHWFLIDAPDAAMATLAKAERGRDVLLLNVSAPGDALRGAACQPELVNVIPSRAMIADALGQFLRARKWFNILVLRGPLPEDKADAAAFVHAAKLYGLNIVATRDFIVSNDPRRRDEDNYALLTGAADYDVVYVADADGTFARALPYATIEPRPVVGATGLVPTAWSWAWSRYGAPQVSDRFRQRFHRKMTGIDWIGWIAVRALDDALRESHAATTEGVDKYLLGPAINIDGAKGPPLSFRSWDNQLRQPILLATSDAVIAAAPMPGFLHETNVLDTLGADKPETTCHF